MRRLILVLLATVLLAGCSVTASGPAGPAASPTTITLATYHDARYHFSFRYPAQWSVPANGGRRTQLNGVPTYLLTVKTPGNVAGIRITVDQDLTKYTSI